ncbi:MAG: hypothetical protein WCL32_13360 [Planctomycetota bacterium]
MPPDAAQKAYADSLRRLAIIETAHKAAAKAAKDVLTPGKDLAALDGFHELSNADRTEQIKSPRRMLKLSRRGRFERH